MGKSVSSLDWIDKEDKERSEEAEDSKARSAPPWEEVLEDGQSRRGRIMALSDSAVGDRTFVVSASPICDESGRQRGAI